MLHWRSGRNGGAGGGTRTRTTLPSLVRCGNVSSVTHGSLLRLQGSAQTPRMNPCPSARAGERLSGLSSCIGESGTRIACFGIEADQKLAGKSDAKDHFFLSGSDQPGTEVGKAFVIARGGGWLRVKLSIGPMTNWLDVDTAITSHLGDAV
jgi:hypothetical protein